jgi:hypothetical protein
MISSMKTIDPRELLGDTFRYGEAREAGLSGGRLYRLRDAGAIVAVGGGVYRWADAPPADLDLIEIAERVPRATLCLETALARHGLIDSIPAACTSSTLTHSTSGGKRWRSVLAPRSASIHLSARLSTSSARATCKAATSRGRRYGDGCANQGETPRS